MTAGTCACGQPVHIVKSGECKKCYDRRLYRQSKAKNPPVDPTQLEKGQRYKLAGSEIVFRADASLDLADAGLLGVLLICDECEEPLGPVRSEPEARVEIVAHLVRSHDLIDFRSVGRKLVRVKQPRPPRFHDELPIGYWSDVSVLAPGLYGAVIICEVCRLQLGPVFNPPSAAMAIHGHQLRAHNPTGRSLA